MWRSLIEEFFLFILPFGLFAGWLLARRKNPFDIAHWAGHVFWLTMTGLILAISAMIYAGAIAPRHTGAYDPPHMENGQLVPGRFKDR
jgi:hypothetical protein